MVKLGNGFAAVAALGLIGAVPASAQTRAAQSLPTASAPTEYASPARSSESIPSEAAALGGGSSGLIVGLVLVLLAVLLGASGGGGGGGGGPDSPG